VLPAVLLKERARGLPLSRRDLEPHETVSSRQDDDPYLLLGVHRQAAASDIGRAYRRAARATHPDGRPGDPSAPSRFRAVTAAYETLSDPGRRAAYDRAHPVARPVSNHRGTRATPPPVRLGAPPRARAFGLDAPPLGSRLPSWAAPVDVFVGGWRSPLTASAVDDLLELTAALTRSLRPGWLP
jgi:curved DNA-binding protein CbpA